MQQLAVKAAVSEVSDLGEFEAIAATYDVDRVKDRIRFGAFEKTIAKWQASGKNLPLHWNHSGAAQDIIGAVDPATMREVQGEGLHIAGRLDLDDSEVAREAWRSIKNDAVALSFGYMVTKAGERRDGIQELLEIDLFEISVTPGPANPETRFLSMKAVAERRVPTDAELRQRWVALKSTLAPTTADPREQSDRLSVEMLLDTTARHAPEPRLPTDAEHRREWDRLRLELVMDGIDRDAVEAATDPGPSVPTEIELRDQAKSFGLPLPPRRQGTRERFRDDMFCLLMGR